MADSESTQNFVKIRTSSSSVGALCVELWPNKFWIEIWSQCRIIRGKVILLGEPEAKF